MMSPWHFCLVDFSNFSILATAKLEVLLPVWFSSMYSFFFGRKRLCGNSIMLTRLVTHGTMTMADSGWSKGRMRRTMLKYDGLFLLREGGGAGVKTSVFLLKRGVRGDGSGRVWPLRFYVFQQKRRTPCAPPLPGPATEQPTKWRWLLILTLQFLLETETFSSSFWTSSPRWR